MDGEGLRDQLMCVTGRPMETKRPTNGRRLWGNLLPPKKNLEATTNNDVCLGGGLGKGVFKPEVSKKKKVSLVGCYFLVCSCFSFGNLQ